MKVVAQNRKARHEYFIEETYEAGIQLKGSEIKSIRAGKVNINDAHITIKNGELLSLVCMLQHTCSLAVLIMMKQEIENF